MMKFGREIFFTRGLYNNPGNVVGPFRDLIGIFYAILFDIFIILKFIYFWHILRENDEMWVRNIVHMTDS